ncbi:GIY-YIG nuclease family protein [Amycolatopsis sp. NPDC059021]|uniref:GIY-YIG nuclease family protein n=1 Tax=Amycolatopsis sp. NPDC059021 TaxID=3346704 RepID=UPI00366D1804
MIQFDNLVIKVGRTSDASTRRHEEHARDAARFGLAVVNVWSAPVGDAVRAEDRLLRRLDTLGQRTSGREYFRRIPFTVARHIAEGTGFRLEEVSCCCGRCVGSIEFTLRAVALTSARDSEDGGELQAEFRLADGDRITGVLSDPDLDQSGRYPLRPGQPVEIQFERRSIERDTWQIWGVAEQST